MEQITVHSRARVPAITCGSSATSSRLDRHLSVLAGPAIPQRETIEATSLMRELTAREPVRDHGSNDPGSKMTTRARVSRVSLFAPLRRLRRSLFGGNKH
ncbi:hypothetical protein OG352_08945 [Streptomyces sp. NBC_01485]|uniref:hypothetical protein n=1 Tax=Streptomyces sp. NBC_01485 TaxID=2903884 RepID=UPI002E30B0E1|nr:hypothetical protein [Streptomyces sp. NBC_01485]